VQVSNVLSPKGFQPWRPSQSSPFRPYALISLTSCRIMSFWTERLSLSFCSASKLLCKASDASVPSPVNRVIWISVSTIKILSARRYLFRINKVWGARTDASSVVVVLIIYAQSKAYLPLLVNLSNQDVDCAFCSCRDVSFVLGEVSSQGLLSNKNGCRVLR
jgi:hypothetical protein